MPESPLPKAELHLRVPTLRRAIGLLLAAALAALSLPAFASASAATRTVSYHGHRLSVPRSWPVYKLAAHPSTCVRFNRHAVYLGTPGRSQACPPHAVGRTEAIVIEASTASANPGLEGSGVARRIDRTHGVSVLATWNHAPAVIEHALHFRSLRAMSASAPAAPPPATGTSTHVMHAMASAAAASSNPAAPGQIFTGYGFDACAAPSSSSMSAWGSSPYRAIGVYIGGVNRGCSQPNLTSTWVSQESAAGWHMIPIYVGRQAPTNSCGCQGIVPSSAASEGTAAAIDAVSQAQAVGIGAGNPIYFDMEYYSRTSTNSSAVLQFLGAWTSKLHAQGYLSGMYSNDTAGISDLVSRWGTGYAEPDEVWAANWNGTASTADAYIPGGEWANHQRLHQYTGGTNQTYGGVTINIDKNYLDASTAAFGSGASTAAGPPVNLAAPGISGYDYGGLKLSETHGSWSPRPTSYSYKWYRCDGAGNNCAVIGGASAQSYLLQNADVGHTLRVAETGSNGSGSGTPATSPASGVVQPAPSASYWLYTAYGNVYNAIAAPFYGSAVRSGITSISGMAATPDRHGYWLVSSSGRVWRFGDATPATATSPTHPVIGIQASPGGGYYLFTAYGNVYNRGGAAFHGSPRARRIRTSTISGMAVTPDGGGYWLVNQAGRIFSFGDAAQLPAIHPSYPVRGIVAAHGGGAWLWTAHGNIYDVGGAPFYSSPYHQGWRIGSVTGMAETPNGQGYWVVRSGGGVLTYGNAPALPPITPKHPVIGISG